MILRICPTLEYRLTNACVFVRLSKPLPTNRAERDLIGVAPASRTALT